MSFNGGIATSYAYDPIGRLSTLTNNLPAATYNNQWAFSFSPAGQITSQSRSNDQFAFTGNVNVDRAYSTNGLNQYTAAGPAAFCYDQNGNLTADGASVYLYDVENRLVEKRAQTSTTCPSATAGYTGALQAALRYDPMGRLYEVSGGASGTTRMLYDGDALTAEYDAGGTLLRRYVHGADGAADDPIAWYEGAAFSAANEQVMRSDWQGSVVLVTDGTGNTVLALNRFDEYGIPQSTNAGRFQYTGQAWLAELGMYYYKARIYSPTLGRFLQTDPIGYEGGGNLYAYVANDPVNNTDSTGEVLDTIADIGFLLYDGYKIATEGATRENVAAAGADIVATVVPFATGGGLAVRAAAKAARAERAGVRAEQAAAKGTAGGERAGKPFTRRGRETIDSRNAARNGKPTCENCRNEVVPGQKSEKGVTPPGNERQRDHIQPRSKGGDGSPANGKVLCRDCNLKKRDRTPE